MKKKLTLILVILINISYFCFSQAPQEGNTKKAESLEVAFLTKELALTNEEAQQLWPVYNNYKNEIKTTRKENKDDQIALDEKILNIRKKYRTDFKTILGSEERVNKLFVAEKSFKEMLKKELLKRRIKKEEEDDEDLE